MRIACLEVPLFPLAALLRNEPELDGEAVAVVTGDGGGARIVAASRRARRAGVRTGLTLAQARTRVARLLPRIRDREGEAAAREALLEAAETVSPRIEDGGEGLAYADLEGLERHFADSAAPEEAMGEALIAAVEATGLHVRVGIAGSKLAARIAAATTSGLTVIPPGEEAAFLAPLPLDHLAPPPGVAETLARWGVSTLGELARLPPAEVASRLGQAGETLHAAARGVDHRPLAPRHPAATLREGVTLDWPLVSLEPFLFAARTALERLCQRLERRGLACRRLDLVLALDPEGHTEHTLELPAPTTEAGSLLPLLRLRLEERPPGSPVTAFALIAHPDRPQQDQLSLFGPVALAPGRLATTLARLFALLGADRVGSPLPVDGHRPERFRLVDYTPPPPPDTPQPPSPPAGGRGLLAVRTLRPPVPLEVVGGEGPDGARAPRQLRILPGEADKHRPRLDGRVRLAAGPWRLEEAWWAEDGADRDYWDVELGDGGLYRIFRDRRDGAWYADGIYD